MADLSKYYAANALQRFRDRYGIPKNGPSRWKKVSEFTQYLEDRRRERGEEPRANDILTPGQRLYYHPYERYATADKGVPLWYSASTQRYTTQDTGIPGVFQDRSTIDIDDAPGITVFPTSPRVQASQSKVGDQLFYHSDGKSHWYDTNPAAGQPLYSTFGKDGQKILSLQGDQPAYYGPQASSENPFDNLSGTLQEYRPGNEIIHPNSNPTSLVTKDAYGNDIILPVGAAANDLAGKLGYGIDAPTSGAARGLMSQAGARTGLSDLFKAAGTAVSGVFNSARQYLGRSADARYTDTSHTQTPAPQPKFADLPKADQQRAVAVEVIRRTAKAGSIPEAVGNWWENQRDQTNLIPVNRGTLEEVGDDKFQATLDRGDVEWMTWDEYMTKKTELSFTQTRDYFQEFARDPRPDTIIEAEKLGWTKPSVKDAKVKDVFGRTLTPSLANHEGATAYASFVENSAAAFMANQYKLKDAQAWKAQARGDYADGQRLRVEAIQFKRMSGQTGLQDPYFAYSWIENKAGEKKFIETVAAMEMHLGRELSDLEVWRARDNFVNPYTEFAGDAVFDWTNIAGGFLEQPVRKLLKPLGSLAAQTIKQANVPVVTPLVRYFGERSVRSAAGRFGHGSFEVFMGVAHSVGGDGSEGFIKRLDEVGKAVAGGLPAEGDVVKLLNLPAEFGGRQERILLGLGNAFSSNPELAGKGLRSVDWGELGESAYKEVWQKARDAAEKQGVKLGKVDEDLIKFASDEADKVANVPSNLVPVMSTKFREGYLQAFGAKPLGGIVGAAQEFGAKAMNLWTAAVLSSRPAWMFRNWADNMFRYMVFGGSNPFENLDLLVGRLGNMPEIMTRLDRMGVNPTELTETFARSTLDQGGETVAQRVRMGWRPKTFVEYFSQANKQAWQTADVKVGDEMISRTAKWAEVNLDPSIKGRLFQSWLTTKSTWNTITGGITDWNAAVETAFKIRMFDQQFQTNMTRLSAYGKKRILQQMKAAGASERVQGVMGKVWDQYYTDPESLRRMVADLRVGNTSTFQVISQLVPDNLDEMLSMLEPSARAEFTRTVVENMKVVMETARLNGQKFDSDAFFDELITEFNKQKPELLNQIDTRDAPDPHLNGKAVAGEVDMTPSNGAVPKAAEASAFTEVKKSVPEAVSALKNARDPKAIASNVRDAVGRRWNVVEAPKGSKPYIVTAENGKVTLAISPDVAKMKGKEARAALREAVAEAVAKEKGFDAADVRKFLDNPAALKSEKPDAFNQLSDFFDDEPDLRKTLAGLQGKERLDYHSHANYPDDDVKIVIEEGGVKKEIKQGYKNPEVNIKGKKYEVASAKLNDVIAEAPGSPKSIYLFTAYQQVDLVKSRLRKWALNVYPGPKAVSKSLSGPLWDMWEDMLYKIYDGGERVFRQLVDSTADMTDEMIEQMPQQSLSQILGQFGYTFQFKKDGSLRRIIYHPNDPKLKYHPPTQVYSMNQFLQTMFGSKAANGPDMQRLIMQDAYTRQMAQGFFPEVSEVTSEIVEQVVKQIDDEVIEMTADFRGTVKKTLGIELDESGTKKLVNRRTDTKLRAVIDKVQRNEGLTAEEAKILLEGGYVQSTGLPNKVYWSAVVEGKDKELPYKIALDLDFLKWFNDTGGHPLGDELLKAFAESLEKSSGKGNAFHLSGDEFLAMFPDQASAEKAMAELEQEFGSRTFVFKEFKDGQETGNAVNATGITFGWGGGDTAKSADDVLIARKQSQKLTRGKEPGGVARTPRSNGVEPQRVEGGAGQAGREYVDLSETEKAQIETLRSTPVTTPTAGRKLPKAVKEKVEQEMGIKLTPDGTKKIEVVETTLIDPDDPGNFEVRRTEVEGDLTPAETAKVAEQLQRQQAIYSARTRLYQPVNKIKDPASRELVQNEAQEMMLDVFAIDGFEGKPLSAAEFKEQLKQYSWATKLVDKLPDDNPRRALVEALMKVVSGEGVGDELADGLRKLTAYNLENGVARQSENVRLAHPHIRSQMLHEDIEDLTKQWTDGLKRDPQAELTAMRDSRENAQALWDAYIQQPWVNNKSIQQAWGQFARDPQLLAAHLRDTLANLPEGVSDETIEGLQMFIWQVQNYQSLRNNVSEKLGLLRSARDAGATYIPLSKTVTQLPDNFASFFARTGEGAEQLSGFEETMKTWKGHAKSAADLPEVNLGAEEVNQLADMADDAARLKQNLVNLAAYGEEPRLYDQITDTLGIEVNKKLTKKRVDGKWVELDQKEKDAITRLQNNLAEQAEIAKAAGGVNEGALEKTNRYMIDYGSTTRMDEWAKKAIPFWTFSSRSFPFWLETLGTHPAILAHYQKYIALNRRIQVQGGIQTTRGDQLPSLEGYVPIPGTDLWWNPTAAFSFRYIIPNFRTYQDEYEDQPVMAQVMTYLYENSNALGVGLAPYLTIPAQSMGWLEGKPTNAIIPQANLLPPWWVNSMRQFMAYAGGPEAVKIFNSGFGADAPWQDFMVERRMLANALARMKADPTRAKAIAAEIRNALDNREQTDLWNETYNEIKNYDYGSSMLGYFTGIYAKDFTDAEVDFLRMRDEVYALRGQVNDTIGAELFDREGSATTRYDQYTDRLYQTPEGYTANVYNMMRYVTTDDGKTPNPEERRDLISKSLDQDANVQAYYQAMTEASNRYQAELATLPIGADSELRSAAYMKFMAEREAIKEDFPGLLPSWTIGYKPQEMVFENFEDEFWKAVNATKPRRDANEDYEDWQLRVAQWQADIPTIMAGKADLWMPILAKELKLEPEELARQTQIELPGGRSLDIPALTQEMLTRATVEGYTEWKKRKDSALDALDAGWTDMYYDKYWEYLKGKSGYDRDFAEREFLEKRPKPTTEELIAWVSQEYPGRWTPAQLKTWIEGRKMETVESRLEPKDENEQMAQEVWDILAWAGPNKKKLQAEFEELGGYWSSINMWWDSGGQVEAWKDPEDFKKVYDLLKQAARKLNLTDPDSATLQEWTQAQTLDKQLKSLYTKELGEDYLDVMGEYWNADTRTRRQLRKQYPIIDRYYDMRDAWIEQNPLWAKYYTEQEAEKKAGGGGSGGYGGGYRRYGGGGGGGWVDYPESAYTVGLGGRSTLNVDMLPGSLGKGQVSRGVRISKSVAQLLGEAAVEQIEKGIPDQELHDYVKRVAKRHPEHQATWDKLMEHLEDS
jgi:GGDEF domain-containing protein